MAGDDMATITWRRLSAAFALTCKAADRALLPLGMTLRRFQPLQVLAAVPHPVTISHLAALLALEIQSATALVHRMARQGWVERRRDLPDRRAVRIVLTDAGQRTLREGTIAIEATFDTIFSDLTAADRAWLTSILGRIDAYARAPATAAAMAGA